MTMLIAVAEDEEILAKLLKEKLESEGFQVLIAKNGEQALNILKKTQPKPNLVLLDLIMPVKDGFAVLAEMAKDPLIKNIPVMVLSNLGDDEAIKKALSLGAVDYFVKAQHPIAEIVKKIRNLLKKPKVTRKPMRSRATESRKVIKHKKK